MAKDNRVIHSGVVLAVNPEGKTAKAVVTRTFTGGMEDELEEAMTADQADHLTRAGAISGTWHPKGKSKADAGQSNAEKATAQPPKPNKGT